MSTRISTNMRAGFATLAVLALALALAFFADSNRAGQALAAAPDTPPCGQGWRVAYTPDGKAIDRHLYGVAAVSPGDVWAVGFFDDGSNYDKTLTMHWDGSQWNVSDSPSPGSLSNYLYGVAALSPNDVWAVGYYYDGSGVYKRQTLTMHWDGSLWKVIDSPNPSMSSNYLYGVAATSPDDVWAVGYSVSSDDFKSQTLIMHWDGSLWKVMDSPNPRSADSFLSGVAAVSSKDVWAVGYYYEGTARTLTMHWDGFKWDVIDSPNPDLADTYLSGIAAVSASDVWAVGYYDDGTGKYHTLTMHWNGFKWEIVSSPNPSEASINFLNGVAAVSAGDVWAVGFQINSGQSRQTLTMHWDGSQWNVVDSENLGASHNHLNGVAAVSGNDVWAVGWYVGDMRQALVLRFNDPCASGALVGNVIWQGPPAPPNPAQQLPIALTLKLGSIEVSYPDVTTDVSGNFMLPVSGLASGTYSWRAKGPKYLANAGKVEYTGQPVTYVDIGFMKVGDANDDNVVGITDFSIVKATFGLSPNDVGYDSRADFTNDNLVNMLDFSLLKLNYGKSGAPPLRP